MARHKEKTQQRVGDPNQKSYVRLTEQGKQKYFEIHKIAYKEMMIWIGFAGALSYFTYYYLPFFTFLKKSSRFNQIRLPLSLLPFAVFVYHGSKLMNVYKNKEINLMCKDPANIIPDNPPVE